MAWVGHSPGAIFISYCLDFQRRFSRSAGIYHPVDRNAGRKFLLTRRQDPKSSIFAIRKQPDQATVSGIDISNH
jgi:hypothetical protein